MKYGLIGEKLGHSFSKEIHTRIAGYDYRLCELAPADVEKFIRAREFCAINVTIPYKETVMPFLDHISENARKIGAVNTVVNREGVLYGFNTDYAGSAALIRHNHIEINGKKVLILGTGGTCKTLTAVTRDMGAREIIHVSRGGGAQAVTYEQAINNHADAQIIINTTPVGMFPHNENCPLDLSPFTRLEGVVDVIYNPLSTKLIMEAQERHIKTAGGLYMLVAQAVFASSLFTGQIQDDSHLGEETESLIETVYQDILQSKQNIVLIGMPSCGKSTVGKLLAEMTGRKLVDTDAVIVERTGKTIPQIFAEGGESEFRRIEHEVVVDIAKQSGIILATGGGAILNTDNVLALSQNGILFFLDRPLESLQVTADRPLSASSTSLETRYRERYPLYCACAHVCIPVSGTPEDVAEAVLHAFTASYPHSPRKETTSS